MEERNTLEKIKLGNDIAEIDNLLNNPYGFDKQKAIEIIKKHHFSDWNIRIADMFLDVNYSTLQMAPDVKIINYLSIIKIYFQMKLLNHSDN